MIFGNKLHFADFEEFGDIEGNAGLADSLSKGANSLLLIGFSLLLICFLLAPDWFISSFSI